MLFKKKRRRRIAEELKENLIAQDQLPSTSAVHLSCKKALFGKVELPPTTPPPLFPADSCDFPFDYLPSHVQESIFRYLPLRNRIIFEKVCSRWRTELRASWRDVRSAEIPSAVVQLLVTRRPIDDSHVCGFLHKCGPYLEHIYMSVPHFHIAQHALYSICQMCTNLRSLSLVTDLDSMALSHLLKQYSHQLSSLRSLVIKYERIDAIPNGLRAVARSMTSLREFELDSYALPSNVSALFPNSPYMAKYSLNIRQPWRVDESFVREFFSYIADVYSHLEVLEVTLRLGVASFDDSALKNVLERLGDSHSTLRELRMDLAISSFFVTPEGPRGLGVRALSALSHYTALRCLHLTSCELPSNFAWVLTEAAIGTKLIELSLRNVQNISGPQLLELFSALPALATFLLAFSVEDGFHSPRSIDSQVFVSMFMLCFGLTTLELTECRYVDRMLLVPAFRSAFHNAGHSNWNESEEAVLRLFRCGPDGGSLHRKRKVGAVDAAVCCDMVDFSSSAYSLTVHRFCTMKSRSEAMQS